jgi:hypothetical protein
MVVATMVLVVACGDVDERAPSVRSGFAVDGSIETSFAIHLYRTTLPPVGGRGLVIQFHARGPAFRLRDDVPLPAEALVVCAYEVGRRASRVADSCRTVALGAEFELGAGGNSHAAVEVLAPGDDPLFLSEFIVSYEPFDAFLAIEFPAT